MMKRIFLFSFSVITAHIAMAQWNSDPVNGGTIVNNAITTEEYQASVTDGANGSIVVFESSDNNGVNNIYAQRVNSTGQIQWGLSNDPKPVCLHGSEKSIEQVIPDASGGVFVAWYDFRNSLDDSDVYVQHLNSNGDPLWSENGIKINNDNDKQASSIRLCSDGGTGVIVIWSESFLDGDEKIKSQLIAQKYANTGTVLWGEGGLDVCTAGGNRGRPAVVSDGSGGAIVAFFDTRNQLPDDQVDNKDIYAQRINSSGALLWSETGVAVATQPYNQSIDGEYLQTNAIVSDGAGGAIILFDDYTGDNDGVSNLYVQRLNSAGVPQWTPTGLPLCVAGSEKFLIKTQTDGAGGLIAFWSDDRDATDLYSCYMQRILNTGLPAWDVNGIIVIDNMFITGFGNDMINDGSNNYIFSWADELNHLMAQKINNNGEIQWAGGDKEVCTNAGAYPSQSQIVKSDAGNSLISWLDNRNYTNSSTDIYSAKLGAEGFLVGANSYVTVTNGNWNNGATWQGGIVPPATADVRIRHLVVVTANTSCHSVRIEPSAGNLSVNAGVNLSILE
jgi:hypothetical protein